MQDIFQNVTEEKQAAGITGKLHEAKSTKSFDSFEIISRFASSSSFKTIIASVKEVPYFFSFLQPLLLFSMDI